MKRLTSKLLMLSLNGLIGSLNVGNCLLSQLGDRVLFVPRASVSWIYSYHLKHISIMEIKDDVRFIHLIPLLMKVYFMIFCGRVDRGDGVSVFANAKDVFLIKLYRRIHPNRKIIVRYHDILRSDFRGVKAEDVVVMMRNLKSKGVIDALETYSRVDAKRFNFIYRPNAVNSEEMYKLDVNERDALYRFIGSGLKSEGDQSRVDSLKLIHAALRRLYPNIERYLDERILNSRQWIPYEQYIKEIAKSEVIIDLIRLGDDEGFPYRIPEALFLNRKIITNRWSLRNEAFYSPQRVFIVGIDDVSNLQEFLERDLCRLPKSVLNLYDASLWWTDGDPIECLNNRKDEYS